MKRILLLALAVCVMLFALTGCRASGNITADPDTDSGMVDGNGSRDGVIDKDNSGKGVIHGDIDVDTGHSTNGGMNANNSGTGGTGTNNGNTTDTDSSSNGGGTGTSTGSNGTGIGTSSAG